MTINTAIERAAIRQGFRVKQEWFIRQDLDGNLRIGSHTHSTDVELELTGNWNDEERQATAELICRQLNLAEEQELRDELSNYTGADG